MIPLRVLYVVDEFPVLTQTFITDEIAERRRHGDEVTVLAMWPKGDGAIPTVGVETAARRNLRVAAGLVSSPRRVLRARATADAAHPDDRPGVPWRSLLGRARDLGPFDLVHAHFGWSAAVRAEILSNLLGAPWSLTLHGTDVYGNDRELARKLRAADLPITVCSSFADHLRAVGGRDVAVVPCGVTVPAEVVRPAPTVDLVTVGRLVPKKGVDALLQALSQLAGVTATVVGDGPERAALERQAVELGIAARVRFAGPLSHDATLAVIASARVCCVPSRVAGDGDRDSMPVVAKEAMASGTPVVVTAVEGLPELVDASCGWVVPPDDVAGLAHAIAHALGDPAVAALRAARARDRVRTTYAIEVTVARLRALEADLVARWRPSVRSAT